MTGDSRGAPHPLFSLSLIQTLMTAPLKATYGTVDHDVNIHDSSGVTRKAL